MSHKALVTYFLPGLVIFLGVSQKDTGKDAGRLVQRILTYRIVDNESGRMNRSIKDIGGQILVVSKKVVIPAKAGI